MTLKIIKSILVAEVLHFPIAIFKRAETPSEDLPLQRIKIT